MTRLSTPCGWLLYAGNLGQDMTVAGDVLDISLSRERSPGGWDSRVQLVASLSQGSILTGSGNPPEPLENLMWAALASWPRNGRRWPPQLRALAALARRYPEAYVEALEAETEPPGLRVVPDPWLAGP